MLTLTCCQDHILTENIWFVCSEASYSGDERRCHQRGTNDEQLKIELLSQCIAMEAESRVSQFHILTSSLVSPSVSLVSSAQLSRYSFPPLLAPSFLSSPPSPLSVTLVCTAAPTQYIPLFPSFLSDEKKELEKRQVENTHSLAKSQYIPSSPASYLPPPSSLLRTHTGEKPNTSSLSFLSTHLSSTSFFSERDENTGEKPNSLPIIN